LAISNVNAQILRLKRKREERKRWHMWPDYKRYSKKEDWYVLYGKRHRNIVRRRVCPPKAHSC